MWNVGRDDEHFLVTEEGRLEGLEAPRHSGRKGIYNPEDLLMEDVFWEAHRLKRK